MDVHISERYIHVSLLYSLLQQNTLLETQKNGRNESDFPCVTKHFSKKTAERKIV